MLFICISGHYATVVCVENIPSQLYRIRMSDGTLIIVRKASFYDPYDGVPYCAIDVENGRSRLELQPGYRKQCSDKKCSQLGNGWTARIVTQVLGNVLNA